MAPDKQACIAEDDEIFCYSITTDNNDNVIYSDLAGRFPVGSYTGMNYYFVYYVYKCNCCYGEDNGKQKRCRHGFYF